jgi:predicted TIM-barrel fold metal-dependent hydrolase
MIIDAHCHAGRGDGFTGPWDTEAALDGYLSRAAAAGIGHTIVFPVFASDYANANARLARIVAGLPHLLTGFCALHPQRDRARLRTIVGRAVETYGFRGIKVHGAEAYPCRLTCALAARYGVPILFDIYRRPERIEMLAGQYPEVDFIVPHLGGFSDDWMTFRVVIDQLARHPNVYADTSGVRYFDALAEAARRAPDKLIFGSDGPLLHPGVELAKVRELHLPPALGRLVLGGRIARLTGREDLLHGGPPLERRPSTRLSRTTSVQVGFGQVCST